MNHEQQINAYLDGRMSEAEQGTFEAAFFADDALAAELDRAIEIRAATAGVSATQPSQSLTSQFWRSSRSILPLAAAAMLGVIAFGLYFSNPVDIDNDTAVLRGDVTDFAVEFGIGNSILSASWPAVDGASQYQVDLYRRDGSPLDRLLTEETSASLAVVADAQFLRVTALGDLGNVLADTGLLALETPD